MASINNLTRSLSRSSSRSKSTPSTLNYLADQRTFTLPSERVARVSTAEDPTTGSKYLALTTFDDAVALQPGQAPSGRQAFQVWNQHSQASGVPLTARAGTTAAPGGEIIAASAGSPGTSSTALSGPGAGLTQADPEVSSYIAGFRPTEVLGMNIFLRSDQSLSPTDTGLAAGPVLTRTLFRLPDDQSLPEQDKLTPLARNKQRMVSTTFSKENPRGSVADAESSFTWVQPDTAASAGGGESMFSQNAAVMKAAFEAERQKAGTSALLESVDPATVVEEQTQEGEWKEVAQVL